MSQWAILLGTVGLTLWPADYFSMSGGVLGSFSRISPWVGVGVLSIMGLAGYLATGHGRTAARKLKKRLS